MTRTILIACAAAAAFLSHPTLAAEKTLDGNPPLITGHRGAPGYLPEHTIAAYKLEIEMGANFIEPDLVITKDGVLVARHEPYLSGKYAIPTFQEVIDLAKAESAARGRTIGIYPETKHPTYHSKLGMPLEDKLLDALKAAGWTEKSSPVIIQSFEVANLKYLHGKTNVRLFQLVDADGVDKDGSITLAVPSERPYDFVVAGDKRTDKDLGPCRDQDLCRWRGAVEALYPALEANRRR